MLKRDFLCNIYTISHLSQLIEVPLRLHYLCLRKDDLRGHRAMYSDMRFDSYFAGHRAYPYISLYLAMVVFYADTGIRSLIAEDFDCRSRERALSPVRERGNYHDPLQNRHHTFLCCHIMSYRVVLYGII